MAPGTTPTMSCKRWFKWMNSAGWTSVMNFRNLPWMIGKEFPGASIILLWDLNYGGSKDVSMLNILNKLQTNPMIFRLSDNQKSSPFRTAFSQALPVERFTFILEDSGSTRIRGRNRNGAKVKADEEYIRFHRDMMEICGSTILKQEIKPPIWEWYSMIP